MFCGTRKVIGFICTVPDNPQKDAWQSQKKWLTIPQKMPDSHSADLYSWLIAKKVFGTSKTIPEKMPDNYQDQQANFFGSNTNFLEFQTHITLKKNKFWA